MHLVRCPVEMCGAMQVIPDVLSGYRNSMPTPTPNPLAVRSFFRPISGMVKLISIRIGSSPREGDQSAKRSLDGIETRRTHRYISPKPTETFGLRYIFDTLSAIPRSEEQCQLLMNERADLLHHKSSLRDAKTRRINGGLANPPRSYPTTLPTFKNP